MLVLTLIVIMYESVLNNDVHGKCCLHFVWRCGSLRNIKNGHGKDIRQLSAIFIYNIRGVAGGAFNGRTCVDQSLQLKEMEASII